ncbi:MAG: PIN domain-containing protein [Candidatus Micrarchaeales archaeon]|nr:PIN domain-containing protein [Candidatus Micrarchaeales archaeon]
MTSVLDTLDDAFFDTTIFVYAYTEPHTVKGRKTGELLEAVFTGKRRAFISNQILAELGYVLLSKYGVDPEEVETIIGSLLSNRNWIKVNYSGGTVAKCIRSVSLYRSRFFDTLIADTMKENSIAKVVTENTKDFEKIEGITIIDPFKH